MSESECDELIEDEGEEEGGEEKKRAEGVGAV